MKIGVLGYGSIGKRHVKNLEAMGHRCYTYDPDNKMSTSRKHIFDVAEAFVIASPTSRHRQDILDVATTGKPMFVEKPVGATNKDWIALKEMTNKDRVFVGYNLRFLQNVTRMKAIIDMADGPPIWARFTCSQFNEKDVYRRDGVILNWSHEIDLAIHLLGPAKVVGSYTKVVDKQDVLTHISLLHDSGCISHIHLDYLVKPQVRGFVIAGVDGANFTADIDGGTLIFESEAGCTGSGAETGTFDDCYLREMEAFINFASGGLMQGCTLPQALDVLDICLRAREQAGLEI